MSKHKKLSDVIKKTKPRFKPIHKPDIGDAAIFRALFKEDKKADKETEQTKAVRSATLALLLDKNTENTKQMKEVYEKYLKENARKNSSKNIFNYNYLSWANDEMSDTEKRFYVSKKSDAAIRAMIIGTLSASLQKTATMAACSAMPTHPTGEGVKGAIIAASCIYMLLRGASKKEVHDYVIEHYPKMWRIPFDFDTQKIPKYQEHFDATQIEIALPIAVKCFLDSATVQSASHIAKVFKDMDENIPRMAKALAVAYYER